MPALFSLTGACQWLCVQKFDQGRVFKKEAYAEFMRFV